MSLTNLCSCALIKDHKMRQIINDLYLLFLRIMNLASFSLRTNILIYLFKIWDCTPSLPPPPPPAPPLINSMDPRHNNMSRQDMDEDVRDFLKEHNLVAYADNFQGITSLSGLLLCAQGQLYLILCTFIVMQSSIFSKVVERLQLL